MRFVYLFVVALIGMSAVPNAHAASAELRDAYEAMMQDPSNVTLNERYITKAIAIKDYEAAIAPLERLAMQDPSNMDYVLRSGEMFKALGSDKVAASYFNKVIASPKSTPEQIARAKRSAKEE